MTQDLTKGANAPIAIRRAELVLTWSGAADVDAAALLCTATGRVRSDDDFIFYNQPTHASRAVWVGTASARRKTLRFDLDAVEAAIQKVVVVASVDGSNFGSVTDVVVELRDPQAETALMRFQVPPASVETAMILGEVYLRDGQWKFRAVGQGYANGLGGVATDYGISVADEPAEVQQATVTSPPQSFPVAPAPAQAINYSRERRPASTPGRRAAPLSSGTNNHNGSEGVAPQSDTAADAPAHTAVSPTARPRPDRTSAAIPALQASASQLAPLAREWQHAVDEVVAAAKRIVEDFQASHADLTQWLQVLQTRRSELDRAFQDRYGQSTYGSGGAVMGHEAWDHAAHALVTRLRTESEPWTDKRRRELRIELEQQTRALLGAYEPMVREFSLTAWRAMRKQGVDQANTIVSDVARRAANVTEPPPPVGLRSQPVDPQKPDQTGPGPLNFYLGHVVSDWLTFSTTAHGNYESAAERIRLPSIRIPVVVDLDQVGALVVDQRRCVEGAVLNLLSALPANQFLIRIFDPEHGGDSAKFLYGLGDSADRIIGDRVKTSDRELSDLLQSTEEHITFVTQRFLQGEHKSLTAYNKAAGEVAEPYQLLVLYDFPSGFSRAGHLDEDQIDRLNKIVRNGPRTGVFTILVSAGSAVPKTTDQLPRFQAANELNAGTLASINTGDAGVRINTSVAAPPTTGTTGTVGAGTLSWRFEPAAPPSDAVVSSLLDTVKRNLHNASDVQVTPAKVAQLADQTQQTAATTLGERFTPTVAHPGRPETWWRATSAKAVVAHFGRIGARQVADLVLDSEVNTYGALVGGRPGSGKSVLIHAVIMSIAMEYAPSEIELFLIDFKEGVEFKQYADIGLPHARVIAIESERDFGLSVLQRAAAEIKTRGELFRGVGQGAANIEQFRARANQPLKRLVLIVDEFQQLFVRDDKIAAQSAEIIELILRQGRAFGIHLVLASQSLAGMAALGKHVLGLIPTRIALQSNEADSRMILGEENGDAQTLVRAGEGILNRKGGRKDANERFQAAFWDSDDRGAVLREVVERANAEGYPHATTVFAGHRAAEVTEVDAAVLVPAPERGSAAVAIPVGLPLTLDPVPLFARLRRESGGNLLIVDEHATGMLSIAVASLVRQGVNVDLLDFVGEDELWSDLAAQLEAEGVSVHGRGGMRSVLSDLAALVDERHELNDYRSPAHVLVVASMGRARDFDPNAFDDDDPVNMLARILRDGPEVGVHVISWFDRAAGINKRLSSQLVSEFGQRLVAQLSRDESGSLVDSDSAASLKPGQGLLADVDRATEHKVRTFASPPRGWLAALPSAVGPG